MVRVDKFPVGVLLVAALAGIAAATPVSQVLQPGLVAVTVTNQGVIGNAFSNAYVPSCEFPVNSDVEHLFLGGVWVGARMASGQVGVSSSAEDATNLAVLDGLREFEEFGGGPAGQSYRYMSNSPVSPYYDPDALAPAHFEAYFRDAMAAPPYSHVPLGIEVTLRALGWDADPNSAFVVFDYTIENASGEDLSDVYVGFFNDTTVGNTSYTDPYDPQAHRQWNFYDDINGGWTPEDIPNDPTLWMMHEHDADGDNGLATSWVGCRLLGTDPETVPAAGSPPVSYNCWQYNTVPRHDDWEPDEFDPETLLPGKYQLMSNGDFDVGVTPDEDYTQPGNRLGLLSTGPFPHLGPGESIRVVFALVLGGDATALHVHSRAAKQLYDYAYDPHPLPAGPRRADTPVLRPAYPNPFNPQTTISFDLPRETRTSLRVYDPSGRLVRALLNNEKAQQGRNEVTWDAQDDAGRTVASGTYFYRLEAGEFTETKKMTLLK